MKMNILKIMLLASVAPALAACGSNGGLGNSLGKAPFADVYKASYATEGKTLDDALSGPGKTLESAAVSSKLFFGDQDLVNQDVAKLIIEYLGPAPTARAAAAAAPQALFKVTFNGASVTFTEEDIQGDEFGDYLEKFGFTSDDQRRTIAYLYSLDGDFFEAGNQVMVPVGFGVRLKRDGTLGTAENGSAFVHGFSVIGLETDPAKMPKDRTATYEGGSELKLRNKLETDGEGIDQIQFRGDSELVANFATGKITGNVDLTNQRVEDYDNLDEETNLRETGASIALSGDIISNGFTLGLTTNDAAGDVLSDLGITDLEAEGAGRFYGTEAEAIGALVSGESTNYVLNGLIWGYENEEDERD